ncbi:cell division protein FtsI [Spiractinospora alimapuensis]|uniref:penicillin-binding transpeptidase domain-containing protein n=1 Tax=Spiractinospora alimapuensis TaxID=2820884 RepID=UPI001F474841|nr:penicillin-binding transpeptidase domain-containing protein [Spiractinospora alimapuensis]QVQ54334.1 cell division protein FtsI [Spiractinospora alimapuensis]
MLFGRLRRSAAVAFGLTAAGALVGCGAEPSAEVAVREFLLEWQSGNHEAAAQRTDGDPQEVAAQLTAFHDQLDLAALRLALGAVSRDGDTAEATFEVDADLGIGDPVWQYSGTMSLHRDGGRWLIDWGPTVIHPLLDSEERLAVTYDVPDRGQILDRDDEPLVEETEVVAFGVRPGEMPDMEAGIDAFAELLDEDPAPFLNRVRSAPPEDFQPLVLMRADDVDSGLVRSAGGIDGVETEETTMPLTPEVAPSLVGEVAGTDEHNIANRVGGPYQAGDTVGLNGLQAAYQQRLSGTATARIVTLDEDGAHVDDVEQWSGSASGTLQTTLDREVQEAAEEALASGEVQEPVVRGSMVAVDSRDGSVLAAADYPTDLDEDAALTAEYRPGAAFSVVSGAAMLAAGVSPEDTAACDPEGSFGDHSVANLSGEQLWGEATLQQNFAQACSAGLAAFGEDLDAEALSDTAATFGIGAEWQLPVDAFPGSVETPAGPGDTAATAAGETGVTVSPLSMALAAGAVADGTWRSPTLVSSDELDQVTAEDTDLAEAGLDSDALEQLRELMRTTVTSGRASAAGVGTVPVHGQVATVPQNVDGEDRVVQWFVGYQGHVAFATAIEVDAPYEHLVVGLGTQYAVGASADFLVALPPDYVGDPDSQADQPSPEDLEHQGG